MCEIKRSLIVRVLPFLLAFSLGLGAAIYLGSYGKDLLIRSVRQKKVLVDTQVVSVPDADFPDLLLKLHIKGAATKVRATVGADGRVTSVTPEHTLYINADNSRPSGSSLATNMILKTELENILSRQVEGTVFAVGMPEAEQGGFEVVVSGNFLTPGESSSSNGCGQIVLTFDADGRILWQGNTERNRNSRCGPF
jgi:hypothetical protein